MGTVAGADRRDGDGRVDRGPSPRGRSRGVRRQRPDAQPTVELPARSVVAGRPGAGGGAGRRRRGQGNGMHGRRDVGLAGCRRPGVARDKLHRPTVAPVHPTTRRCVRRCSGFDRVGRPVPRSVGLRNPIDRRRSGRCTGDCRGQRPRRGFHRRGANGVSHAATSFAAFERTRPPRRAVGRSLPRRSRRILGLAAAGPGGGPVGLGR